MNQTFQAVNQTIGRIIRSKKDYGVILLIDKRYEKKENLLRMSSWFRKCLRNKELLGPTNLFVDI
jgi:Rad3-related DNA helicase